MRTLPVTATRIALLAAVCRGLVSCSSGADSTTNPGAYTIGFTVAGLAGSGLVLQDNGGSTLTVPASGSFSFATGLASGAAYTVTVLAQPIDPAQTCDVTNGTGTVGGKNVTNVTVACATLVEFLYGTNGSGGISGFSINTATGALTPIMGSPFATEGPGSAGAWVTADLIGNFLYSAAAGSNIQGWSANPTNGILSPVAGAPFPGFPAGAIAIPTDGRFAYAPNETVFPIATFSIGGSGALTAMSGSSFAGGTSTAPVSVAVTPNGRFVYVANAGQGGTASTIAGYSLDSVPGALTPLSGSPFASSDTITFGLTQMAIPPGGQFLYVSAGTGSGVAAYSIDFSTGALSPVSGSPFVSVGSPIAITFDPRGKFLFAGNQGINGGGPGGISAFAINATSGALTQVTGSPFISGTSVLGVVVDASGQFLYSANLGMASSGPAGIGAYSIDGATGALTPVAGSPFATTTLSAGIVYYLAILK